MARILVVEDDLLQVLDLEKALQSHGHTICGVANTGDQAVAFARERRPDIVLMDVRLADGSDGIEAAENIIAEHPCGLIFMTA